MTRILFTDLGIAIYVLAGVAGGIAWERHRRGGTYDVRAQRNRLFHQLRHARTDLAAVVQHPSAAPPNQAMPSPTGRRLFSVGGGKA